MPIQSDYAWVTGIFEGEGTVGIVKNKVPQRRICFYNNDLSMIKEIRKILEIEGCLTIINEKGNNKTQYHLQYNGNLQYFKIMKLLEPFIKTDYKKKQIKDIEEFFIEKEKNDTD